MSRQTNVEARAQALIDALKAATSEAAGVRRDLERVMKEARVQVEGYLHDQVTADLNRSAEQWRAEVHRYIGEMITEVHRVTAAAVDRAQGSIENAGALEVIGNQFAAALAARVELVDGVPMVKYGSSYHRYTPPDGV